MSSLGTIDPVSSRSLSEIERRLSTREDPDSAAQRRFGGKAQEEAGQTSKRVVVEIPALAREIAVGSDRRLLGPDAWHEADEEFEKAVAVSIPEEAREKAFYTKIAGTKHKNPDGTYRSRILKDCSVLEPLELRREPDNPFDENAVAVHRLSSGEQLGYLDSYTAQEVAKHMTKHGDRWTAVFRKHTFHPETGKVVGGVIYLIRLTAEFLTHEKN
jgi:hypothetical protein